MPFVHRRPGVADILYVMAAEAECGPHLQARISPLICGVGPVEAGVAVSAHLAQLAATDSLPQIVVSLGSAGSATLEQAEVYQASAVSYRDMDAGPLGFEKGVTPFLSLPAILPMGPLVPGIRTATLSTGGGIVTGRQFAAVGADMVDMETYAIRRACDRFGLPVMAIRGISDGAAELRHIGDWTRYLEIIDEKLAFVVDALEAAVANGTLEWPSIET